MVGERGDEGLEVRGERGATGERGTVGDLGERGGLALLALIGDKGSALSSSTGVVNSSPNPLCCDDDWLNVGGRGGTGGIASRCIVFARGVLSLAADFSTSAGEPLLKSPFAGGFSSIVLPGARGRSVLRRGNGGGTVTRKPSPGGRFVGVDVGVCCTGGSGEGDGSFTFVVERLGDAGWLLSALLAIPHKLPTLAPTLLILERRRGGKGGAFSLSGDGFGRDVVDAPSRVVLPLEYTLAVEIEGACASACEAECECTSSSQTRSMTPARMNAQSEHVVRIRVRHQPDAQRG